MAQRLRRLETALIGRQSGEEALAAVAGCPFDELSPIDDVRASAAYRSRAAAELVRRALRHSHEQLGRDPDRQGSRRGMNADRLSLSFHLNGNPVTTEIAPVIRLSALLRDQTGRDRAPRSAATPAIAAPARC